MTIKNKKKNAAAHGLLWALAAAALCALMALVVVPEIRYSKADKLAAADELEAAADAFGALNGYRDSADRRDDCLLTLAQRATSARDFAAFSQYYYALSLEGTRQTARAGLFSAGEKLLAAGLYEEAWECYGALNDDAEAARRAEACREEYYGRLAAQYEAEGEVPEGFESAALKGYRDSDSYAALRELQSSAWESSELEANVKKLYALGDFLDVRDSAFVALRLFGARYSNAEGYYFGTDAYGDWDYNLPHYSYAGYYGLYAKIDGDTLYTGSDEKQFWQRQFRFSFSDYDRTLSVYCYYTGASITLWRE